MNKVIALLFAGVLMVGMTACDNRQPYDDDDDRGGNQRIDNDRYEDDDEDDD